MTPKFIKFNYRNKERLWLRVIKYENNYYYGYIVVFFLIMNILITITIALTLFTLYLFVYFTITSIFYYCG